MKYIYVHYFIFNGTCISFFNEKLLSFLSTTKIQFHLIDICVWIIVIFIGSTLVNIVD